LGANEGIARPGTANGCRLKEECSGLALGELTVQADGSLGVGQDFESDRDDTAVDGEFPELFQARADDSKVLHGYSSPPFGMRGCVSEKGGGPCWRWPLTTVKSRPSKQVRVPVWQAAPIWSTRIRRASPSQSRATDFTNCTCPEVSPLRQYSWRRREEKVTGPV